uniref:Uncharacterized protein n=1 Tax=Rhizophagus irregularis (strain DAOM 181602 / DAOM 197198 / MUCL 43194) TaxID=747089 RepID=U9U576_RHIID
MSNSRDVSPTQYQYDITMWFITSITSIQPAFIQSAFIQPAFIQSAFIQSAFIQSAFIQSAFYLLAVIVYSEISAMIDPIYDFSGLIIQIKKINWAWAHFNSGNLLKSSAIFVSNRQVMKSRCSQSPSLFLRYFFTELLFSVHT